MQRELDLTHSCSNAAHTLIEGVKRVKQNTLRQVLRVVDECVAMEIEEEADLLSQQQGQVFPLLFVFFGFLIIFYHFKIRAQKKLIISRHTS